MTLSISGTYIQKTSQLNTETQITLGFIDGGLEWLNWAIADLQARYDFRDQTELVNGVQQGLHSSPLCYLPKLGLSIGPSKLMTLGSSLSVLAKAESGDEDAGSNGELKQILNKNKLLTHQDLAEGFNFLKQFQLEGSALFDSLNFSDRLEIYHLSSSVYSSNIDFNLQKEAADFAIAQAYTCQEFSNYFQVYLMLARDRSNANGNLSERANTVLHNLLPLFFNCLEAPQVSGIPAPAEIPLTVQKWSLMSKLLGFPNISSGLLQILKYTDYEISQSISAWEKTLSTYLSDAQSLVISYVANDPPYSYRWIDQLGSGCVVGYKTEDKVAEVVVNNGLISLNSFVVSNRQKTPSSPAMQAGPNDEQPQSKILQ